MGGASLGLIGTVILMSDTAMQSDDHVQFLARLVEMEMIDRERRLVERRIRQACFPVVKQLADRHVGWTPISTLTY